MKLFIIIGYYTSIISTYIYFDTQKTIKIKSYFYMTWSLIFWNFQLKFRVKKKSNIFVQSFVIVFFFFFCPFFFSPLLAELVKKVLYLSPNFENVYVLYFWKKKYFEIILINSPNIALKKYTVLCNNVGNIGFIFKPSCYFVT
jgi:hypothetical protein